MISVLCYCVTLLPVLPVLRQPGMKGINRREESFPLHSVYLHLHHQPHLSDIQTPQQLITISFHVNYTTFPPTLIQIINTLVIIVTISYVGSY